MQGLSVIGFLLFAALCVGSQNYGNCGASYWTESPVVGKPFTIYFPNTYSDFRTSYYIEAPGSREGNLFCEEPKPGVNFVQLNYDSPGRYYLYVSYRRYEKPDSNLRCFHQIDIHIEVSGPTSVFGGILPTTYRTSASDNISFMYGINSTTSSFTFSTAIDNNNVAATPSVYNDAYKNDGLYLVHYSPVYVNNNFQSTVTTSSSNNRLFAYSYYFYYSEFGPTNLQRQYSLDINRPAPIRFNAYSVTKAFVSYNLTRDKTACKITSIDVNDQTIKCPPPQHSGPSTNMIIARFEFHNAQGFQSEVYSQILIGRP